MNIALFGKIRTVWATCAFYVERHLKTYVKNYIQSHAGNVVEFGSKGEPALLGLDFYKQAVEYQQEFAQRQTDPETPFKPMAFALNQQWAAFSNNIIFSLGFLLTVFKWHNRYRISGNGNPLLKKS